MPKGYWGKILRVNLSKGKTSIEMRDEKFYRTYVGGRCLAAYYLLSELGPGVDPLGPDNKLIFTTSVITGAPVPGLSRYNVAAKSPLTGGYGEAQAGGFWGAELKFAGYDALIIEGNSRTPVYLWICDDEVEIRDADSIWGKVTGDAQEIIREEVGEKRARIAQIGPAGENLVRYACIINECKHANGRMGMGAVMGSKKLKAVAVHGHGKIEMDDPETIRELAKWFAGNFMVNPSNRGVHVYGTNEILGSMNETGMLPTKNFQTGFFEGADKISGEAMKETILVDQEGCFACPVRCKRVVKVEEPYKVDPKYGGPEYETVCAFGSNCLIDDLKAIAKANELCNKYGIDTISTGNTIAFAMECYESGIMTKEDTGGLDPRFGNPAAMLELINLIAYRKGIGNILAEGVMRAAEKLGSGAEKFAMHAKGQELPFHDPRAKGMLGMSYALSAMGGDHIVVEHDTDFDFDAPEVYVEQAKPLGLLERLQTEDIGPKKVRMFYYLQPWFSACDTLCLCVFGFAPVRTFKFSHLVRLISAVTGWETSLWEILKLGERAVNMLRAFNIREGFTAKDDRIPQRMFEPMRSGPREGAKVSREGLKEALSLYYRMAGWNPETGTPTEEKLVELDLLWIVDELKKYGKL